MSKPFTLDEIVKLCKGEVSLTFNAHRTNYQDVETFLDSQVEMYQAVFRDSARAAMIEKDMIVELMVYPHTPIGSLNAYAASLEDVLCEISEDLRAVLKL